MRTLILASLLSGAVAWSATGLPADAPPTDDENAAAPAEESAAPADRSKDDDRRRDSDRPRDEARRRRGPEDDGDRGRRDEFRPRRGPDNDSGRRGPDSELDRPPFTREREGDRPFPPEGRFGGPPRDLLPPLLRVLDADGDHELSADEIANAAVALKTLDVNSDGKLTFDELRPQFADRGPHDGDQVPPRGEGRPRRFGREHDGFGPGEGFGPPPERRAERDGERRGFGRRGDGPPPDGERDDRSFRRDGDRRDEFRFGDGPRRRPPHGDRDEADRPRPPRGDREEGDHPRPPRGGPDRDPPPRDEDRPTEDRPVDEPPAEKA